MRQTAEDVRELVDAVLAFGYGTAIFGQRCPYCEGRGEEHLSYCKVAELRRRLLPLADWLERPEDNQPDVRALVLVAREIVFALDGFDPEFCATSLPLVNLLKAKLVPFKSVK